MAYNTYLPGGYNPYPPGVYGPRMETPQPNMQQPPQSQQPASQQIALSAASRPVTNRDEANAVPADFSGALMLFPDITHNRVYVKRSVYSDYCAVAKKHGVNNVDFYADLAKAWLHDKDAVKDKAAAYYEYIVKH